MAKANYFKCIEENKKEACSEYEYFVGISFQC